MYSFITFANNFRLPVSLFTHASAIATDLLVVILTWVKTFDIQRAATSLRMKTPLAAVLLRDGSVYFLCVEFHMCRFISQPDRDSYTLPHE